METPAFKLVLRTDPLRAQTVHMYLNSNGERVGADEHEIEYEVAAGV